MFEACLPSALHFSKLFHRGWGDCIWNRVMPSIQGRKQIFLNLLFQLVKGKLVPIAGWQTLLLECLWQHSAAQCEQQGTVVRSLTLVQGIPSSIPSQAHILYTSLLAPLLYVTCGGGVSIPHPRHHGRTMLNTELFNQVIDI